MFRRTRASWGKGRTINAGLPDELPWWLIRWRSGPGRWVRPARHGKLTGPESRVDWRRTLRRWARLGHADGRMIWRRAPRRPTQVVVLWDVSGSMAAYLGWYFPWIYRLASLSDAVHVFAFGTTIEDLTPHLASKYRQAVRNLYGQTSLWGSGTAIGQAFQRWNERYGPRLLSRRTTVAIISDGWDVGNPEQLASALQFMASRAERLVWINPLMVTAGFEPRTRALMMARRYVDSMTAGAEPESLARLAREWDVI
ncbi:VWA domain-containing protein [Sulfobacillus harzensis]|uniref:VWA domain-containing protein n=1 Tax=Sulfobacillus harzensis TaxID=2729629 RepID=A0A7Y0L4N2_9FIRM|nr:VWA domain-containing protein [Sulfobacillus harzensis]